jgi:hypothetical protein
MNGSQRENPRRDIPAWLNGFVNNPIKRRGIDKAASVIDPIPGVGSRIVFSDAFMISRRRHLPIGFAIEKEGPKPGIGELFDDDFAGCLNAGTPRIRSDR